MSKTDAETSTDLGPDSPLHERVAAILDLIRPAIQSDGGDLELVEVRDDGTVIVRFHGACVGCPSSSITLQVGLERQLKDRIPEVSSVQTVARDAVRACRGAGRARADRLRDAKSI